ncbi:chromate transporter [Paenibacillus hamazuiensis]|uniref:chromate transporter n=1 Tax=Paenibacillus hamazuiensis TaxID=2936508 RepID=UPI00200C69B2|nr:chromate transporter [Paenibacillus hamazuiensis]
MVWSLFITFLKIGFISFGGGYAMIPVIEREVASHGWMTDERFLEAVSVAGMSPGPIATNCATLIGYGTAGLPGAIAATAGMILPSLLLIILLAAFFYKIGRNKLVRASFYGLRPIVTGLVAYAAIRFAVSGGYTQSLNWQTVVFAVMVVAAVIGILRFRVHPIAVIAMSGIVGMLVFH